MSEDWELVTRKSRSRDKTRNVNTTRESTLYDSVKVCEQIERYKNIIEQKSCYKELITCLKETIPKCDNGNNIHELVSYGLGSFGNNQSAKHQLAMLLLVYAELNLIPTSTPVILCAYDPVWNESDRQVLNHFNIEIIPINEECRRKVVKNKLTLYFMIHCDKHLYNNLLWENWEENILHNVIIIGNSFSYMQQNTPERKMKKEYEYIYTVLKNNIVMEKFVTWKKDEDSFNDTLVHCFKKFSNLNIIKKKSTLAPMYED